MFFRVLAIVFLLLSASAGYAQETTGPHAFFNDDAHQFVDVWYNPNGKVTIKVSNGQRYRDMFVNATVDFILSGQVVKTEVYAVMCRHAGGGGGNEQWYVLFGPGVAADSIRVRTNKRNPTSGEIGGETSIPIPIPFF
jgi:hypothetical protein